MRSIALAAAFVVTTVVVVLVVGRRADDPSDALTASELDLVIPVSASWSGQPVCRSGQRGCAGCRGSR